MRLLVLPLALLAAACASTAPAPPPPPPPPAPAPIVGMTAPPMAAVPPQPSNEKIGQSVPRPNAKDFAEYLVRLKPRALQLGITSATWDRAMAGVKLNMKSIELSAGASGGMGRIDAYLERVGPLIGIGRTAMAQHAEALAAAERRTGVPAAAIAGIWGNETGYGRVLGNFYIVEALASLAYEGRRREFFEEELFAALTLIQQGEPVASLTGSYAGALGQVQFMPSNIISLGVDGDGDGRRDLRNSIYDAMASCGNYLAQKGWRAGQPWLAEARLPAGFRWELAGPDLKETAAAWDAMGVRTYDGATLSSLVGPDELVSILLPAGHRGVPMIAFENYRTFLAYNPSQSYAISVALLANRLNGEPGFRQPWPAGLSGMGRADMLDLQNRLEALGYDVGPDGRYGDRTRKAVRAYQLSEGLPADGFPTPALLSRLRGGSIS